MKNIFLIFLLFFFFCPVLIFAFDKVDINAASLAELDKIIGIGPVLAQRIIDARPFSSVEDLLKVKGIGEKTLQKIKDQGLACVNCQTEITTQTNAQTAAQMQTPTPGAETQTPIVYPGGIIFNELLPSPKGADEAEEWTELYNSNNFEVDLFNWQIKDAVGTASTFIIPQDTKILANGFLVLKRPETKIILNNDGDSLSFYTPDNKIIDTVSYTKAPIGQSYNKTSSGWVWSTTLTPGAQNVVFQINAPTNTENLSNSKKSGKNDIVKAGLANISQTANPWFLFLTALTITIILAIIVLLIKFKLNI